MRVKDGTSQCNIMNITITNGSDCASASPISTVFALMVSNILVSRENPDRMPDKSAFTTCYCILVLNTKI